jgi:hypothetical protein
MTENDMAREYLGLPSHIVLSDEAPLAVVDDQGPGTEAYLTTHRVIKFLGDYENYVSVPLYNINSVHRSGRNLYLQLSLAQKNEIPIPCRNGEEAEEFINQVLYFQARVMENMGMRAWVRRE